MRTCLLYDAQRVDEPHLTRCDDDCGCIQGRQRLGYTCRGSSCPFSFYGCTALSFSQHQSHLLQTDPERTNLSLLSRSILVSPCTRHHIAFRCPFLCDQIVNPFHTGYPLSRAFRRMTSPPGSAITFIIMYQVNGRQPTSMSNKPSNACYRASDHVYNSNLSDRL